MQQRQAGRHAALRCRQACKASRGRELSWGCGTQTYTRLASRPKEDATDSNFAPR